MRSEQVLEHYVQHCERRLAQSERAQTLLRRHGITEAFVPETFRLGWADGTVAELVEENEDLRAALASAGILDGSKEVLRGRLIVPILGRGQAGRERGRLQRRWPRQATDAGTQ